MKEEYPYQLDRLSGVCVPVRGGVAGDFGWWDVHTHRRVTDWRHTILNCQPDSLEELRGESLYLSVGIHPWYLTEASFSFLWERLLEAMCDKRVIAIGEAGLDKAVEVPFELQLSAFRRVIGVADEYGFPLIIHAVKASNEMLELKKKLRPRNPWIIHGFRGKKELAQAYLRNGIYLSYGARYQEEALRSTPLDYLFLETDESATDIRDLYARAAKILKVPEINLREKVRCNINKLFFRH